MSDFNYEAANDAGQAANDETMSSPLEREQWVALAMAAATRSIRSEVPANGLPGHSPNCE